MRHVLAEGLERRYTLRTRVEDGERVVVEGIHEPRRLPTLIAQESLSEPGIAQEPVRDLPVAGTAAAHESPEVARAIQVVLDRLEVEIEVIKTTGFVSYFLIVGDFVRKGREMGVTCVARGSAAGSLVTYLLDIANVDPIRYGLLFERFLNP
jgi:DNA polymerase III alpha subunit